MLACFLITFIGGEWAWCQTWIRALVRCSRREGRAPAEGPKLFPLTRVTANALYGFYDGTILQFCVCLATCLAGRWVLAGRALARSGTNADQHAEWAGQSGQTSCLGRIGWHCLVVFSLPVLETQCMHALQAGVVHVAVGWGGGHCMYHHCARVHTYSSYYVGKWVQRLRVASATGRWDTLPGNRLGSPSPDRRDRLLGAGPL